MTRRSPPSTGSAWTGLGLFLLGVVVGAALVLLGLGDSPRLSRLLHGGAEEPPAASRAAAAAGERAATHRGSRAAKGLATRTAGATPAAVDGGTAGGAGDEGKDGAGRQGRGGAAGVAPLASRPAGSRSAGPAAAEEPAGPAAPGPAALPGGPLNPGGGAVRVALVIDDLGRSVAEVATLERLGVPLTYAVLPYEPQTAEVVDALHRRGEEILCHLPMEPRSGGNPGPGALRLGMSRDELRRSTLAALHAVPGAVGVNNHMGSGLSADEASMGAILEVLSARGLFFLDSRTSAQSVGYRVATALGVPAAERQVFLDDDQSPPAVHAQFQRLLEVARERGEAIAIGHPHAATLAALALEVPRAQALGYRFVAVSALLDRRPEPGRAAGR